MFRWGQQHEPFVPKDKNPYEDANWFSRLFFFWITPLISLGYFRPLEASDIPPVPKEFSAEVVLGQFQTAWDEEVRFHGKHADAGRAMFKAFKKNILLSSFNFAPYVITILMQPYLVNDILTYIDGGDDYFFQIKEGISLAILFGIVSLINLLCASMSFSLVSKSCMAMKVATISAVFAKSLRLSTAAKHSHTTGEKMTLISADAERVWYGVMFINWCWAGPLLMATSMVLLIVYVGWAAVAAFAVMLALTLIQLIIGKQVGEVRKKQVKFTDERTKVINESLQVGYVDNYVIYVSSEFVVQLVC
ncbi:hypothetical protein EON65_24255 [archaeon]|nr:MAG: hypothetical protein EON65_24255 [archaeon]